MAVPKFKIGYLPVDGLNANGSWICAPMKSRSPSIAAFEVRRKRWRFGRGLGDEPMIDVTEEVADRERQTIETMDRLIKMYEGRRA